MVALDTNVLSQLMQQRANPLVKQWLDRQSELSVWTTSITISEMRYGVELLPRSRRASLMVEFERLIEDDIQHRIVLFDTQAATVAAGLMAQRQQTSRIGDLRDTMIAGIVIASHAMLVTRNMRHFDDVGSCRRLVGFVTAAQYTTLSGIGLLSRTRW